MSSSDGRIYLRNQRFLPQWSQSAGQKNADTYQAGKQSLDPIEQNLLPFTGPTYNGPAYDNRDFYHRRTTGHHTCQNQHMKLELLMRYECECRLHSPDSALAQFLSAQIAGYDSAPQCEVPTVIAVKQQ